MPVLARTKAVRAQLGPPEPTVLVEGRDGVRGFQCKHRRLTLALVEAEIAKTGNLAVPLNRLDFLTSFESDARLEEQVMALSQARRTEGRFPVGVVFWGTMKDWLAEHQAVAHRHFPQAFLAPPPKQPATPLDRAGADRFRALAARQKRREITVA